eukprot:gene16511-22737_t
MSFSYSVHFVSADISVVLREIREVENFEVNFGIQGELQGGEIQEVRKFVEG